MSSIQLWLVIIHRTTVYLQLAWEWLSFPQPAWECLFSHSQPENGLEACAAWSLCCYKPIESIFRVSGLLHNMSLFFQKAHMKVLVRWHCNTLHYKRTQISSSKLIRHAGRHFASQLCAAQEDDAIERLHKVAVVTEVAGGTQVEHIWWKGTFRPHWHMH